MICKVCGDADPAHFAWDRTSLCRQCKSKKDMERRKNNPELRERHNAHQRAYHAAHREEEKARDRRWYRSWKTKTVTLKVVTLLAIWPVKKKGPPSLEEIAGAVRVSVPTVTKHIEALERAGKIVRQPRKHRGLQLAG